MVEFGGCLISRRVVARSREDDVEGAQVAHDVPLVAAATHIL